MFGRKVVYTKLDTEDTIRIFTCIFRGLKFISQFMLSRQFIMCIICNELKDNGMGFSISLKGENTGDRCVSQFKLLQ